MPQLDHKNLFFFFVCVSFVLLLASGGRREGDVVGFYGRKTERFDRRKGESRTLGWCLDAYQEEEEEEEKTPITPTNQNQLIISFVLARDFFMYKQINIQNDRLCLKFFLPFTFLLALFINKRIAEPERIFLLFNYC